MNSFLDILNNPNEIFENDVVVINLITEEVTWKPMMFNPKYANSIKYWFDEKRKQK